MRRITRRPSRKRQHVVDAVFRQPFHARCVVEHFDRDPAAVIDFAEGLEDRHEVELAHARTAQVRVVGVEVNHLATELPEQIGNRRRFARHGFAIEVQPAMRRADHLAELHAVGGRVQEVAVGRPERFDGQCYVELFHDGHRRAEHFGRVALA